MRADSVPPKILVSIVCYNSCENTRLTLNRIPKERDYDILIVDDGSDDRTPEYVKDTGLKNISHEENRGLGAAIKTGIKYALDNGYDIFVVMAGNNKDDPGQIPRLIEPVARGDADYVQGSRFLEDGQFEAPPPLRRILVKLYVLLFKFLTGFEGTDAINGFRSYHLDIVRDPRINIWQKWLDGYSFETYLFYKVLSLGYNVKEVPVTKSYRGFKKSDKYSHVRPFLDWWNIIKPLLYLKLRLRS